MICKNCKKEINENAMFCPNCGAANDIQIKEVENGIINHPFKEIKQQNNFNQEISNANQTNVENKITEPIMQSSNINGDEQQNNIFNTATNNNTAENNEKVNIGFAILSWFIPLVGVILFFTQKNKKPKTAKVCGIVALVSAILTFIVTAISILTLFSLGNKTSLYEENKTTTTPRYTTSPETTTATKNEDTENNQADNTNWKKYNFSVNGVNLSLPCTFKELENASKFKLNNDQTNDTIKPNHYIVRNMFYNDKLALDVEIYNDSRTEDNVTNGKIKRLHQTSYQVSTNNVTPITFPGNLKVGMKVTKDEIIKLFGTPNDINTSNDSNNYISEKIKYQEDEILSTRNYYEISLVNGIIDELTIDNINY